MRNSCPSCHAPVDDADVRCQNCGMRLLGGVPVSPLTPAVARPIAMTAYAPGRLSPTASGQGALIGGRYRLDQPIARGTFGEVWRGHDERLAGRPCAVKRLLLAGTPEEQADRQVWLRREADILAALDHPGICRIYDRLEEGGSWYLVLEWVEGRTLADELASRGAPGLPEAEVLGWATTLADALSYLHARTPPVVYRDLKPPNIMRCHDGAIKLIDFGIAFLTQASPGTTMGTAIGTPGYVPPEQYQGLAEPASDIYALGATIHHLLSGRDPRTQRPFDYPPVRSLNPALSAQVEAALDRALSMKSTDRYPDMAAFAVALRAPARQPSHPGAAAPPHPPAAQQPPVLPAEVRVNPRGGGDFRNLAKAIQAAAPGATLRLSAGTHRLKGTLHVDKALTLIGEGRDHTRVVTGSQGTKGAGAAATVPPPLGDDLDLLTPPEPERQLLSGWERGAVLTSTADAPFVARGIAFVYQGTELSHVVTVTAGEVQISDCSFSGGPSSRDGGSGLLLDGTARGLVTGCMLERNGGSGILVQGQARPVLGANTCERNEDAGIEYWDKAGGRARANICRGNKGTGLMIRPNAQPLLEANTCMDNTGEDVDDQQRVGWSARRAVVRRARRTPMLLADHMKQHDLAEYALPLGAQQSCQPPRSRKEASS